jgi:hypothetical protein
VLDSSTHYRYSLSMKTIKKHCEYCKLPFDAPVREHKRGRARFCTLRCAARSHQANIAAPPPNCVCAHCGIKFHKPPSKVANSKSGLVFCCRAHKDTAQRIGGIAQIMPKHYGTDNAYRRRAFATYPHVCSDCSWDKYSRVLVVHHIDGDHSNNDLDNLKLVCPTCHSVAHYRLRGLL